MFDTGSPGSSSRKQNNKNKPHSFQKKKKSNKSGENKGGNYSVTATTSKAKTPLPPNQEKKVNNKKAAKKKREKLIEMSRNSNKTPLSATSETRDMLDQMELNEESFYSSDSDAQMLGTDEYKELPTDALILNTETVEKIIEQIATDIEESEDDEENGAEFDSDSDEFGEGEALNAGVKRYFIENSGPKCFNCGESGHVLKDCPASSTVPCNLCGQVGHSRFNCPQEVCYNCSRPGHQSKACPSRRKRRVYDDDLCNRCGQPGHLSRECSMAWRGYVFARDLPRSHSSFLDELRGLRKRCYNCASISHFGDDCPNRRRPNYSVFHIPDYDYLDRVILRIKAAKKEAPNARQIQADNFKKIIENSGGKHNNSKQINHNTNVKNNKHVNHNQQQNKQAHNSHGHKQHQHQKQQIIREDDFTMYDEDFDDHKEHLSNAKSANRKVFLQSRGIEEEKPVSFVHYEGNQVKVKKYDGDDEDEGIKKGSSKKQQHHHHYNKPSYHGGYK